MDRARYYELANRHPLFFLHDQANRRWKLAVAEEFGPDGFTFHALDGSVSGNLAWATRGIQWDGEWHA